MYSIDGLELGIIQCKKNIKVFEEAIAKEYATISEYRQMIEVLERKALEAKRKVEHIVTEVICDKDDGE